MEILFHVKSENLEEVEMILSEDPYSRQSIITRNCNSLDCDVDGYFILVRGDEEVLESLKTALEGLAEVVEGEEADDIIERIKEEEDSALQGFGTIFGG